MTVSIRWQVFSSGADASGETGIAVAGGLSGFIGTSHRVRWHIACLPAVNSPVWIDAWLHRHEGVSTLAMEERITHIEERLAHLE